MKQKVQEELQRAEKEKIRPVKSPTGWYVPIVAVQKSKS